MRILICDDDSLMREKVQEYIKSYFKHNSIACPEIALFSDGESLLRDPGEKDIVFLDIEMPGMSGVCVGNELKKANHKIIIFVVTAYLEYLDDAMRFNVFRYLSKPLDKQRFFRNMKEALTLYYSSDKKIPIETKQGVCTLPISSIIMVEAQGKKVIVHTLMQDFESTHTIQYWIGQLSLRCFFQTHRSFIVNMEHVVSFDHSLVYLADGQFRAYLTKRRYHAFKEAYLLYMESIR